MKALVCNGPHDVNAAGVPDARIEKFTDMLVRITGTTICGSDLHMYDGRATCSTAATLGTKISAR